MIFSQNTILLHPHYPVCCSVSRHCEGRSNPANNYSFIQLLCYSIIPLFHLLMMKTIYLLLAAAMLLTACNTVPLTGRKQLSLVSNSEVLSLSYQEYGDFIKTTPLSSDAAGTAAIKRVGAKLEAAVKAYLAQTGQNELVEGYEWEFNLVQGTDVNAFCMPGGKVVFYEGIMPITKDDTGIAVVMGHEIAHAIARHGNERMSQQMMAQLGTTAVSAVVSSKSQTTQTIANTVFGLGAQYGVLLPYSRKHELEADHLGLIFMAMAGYNPQEAVPFWQRMSANGGAGVAEFMSTHPSDDTRINELTQAMPEAMKFYKPSGVSAAPASSGWKF
jgi:predicted Zn-dependent protease